MSEQRPCSASIVSIRAELEKGVRDLHVRVDGQLVFNDRRMIVRAPLDGLGLACVLEDLVAE